MTSSRPERGQLKSANIEFFIFEGISSVNSYWDKDKRLKPYMIQSPLIVVEVLSPSTERYDRTEKFARYMRCPTLEVYILAHQDEQHIEVYRRSMGWKQERFSAGQAVKLEQLDLELPVESTLECEPATHFVLRFASAGAKGSIYEGVL